MGPFDVPKTWMAGTNPAMTPSKAATGLMTPQPPARADEGG
jgi:hypothetical protein